MPYRADIAGHIRVVPPLNAVEYEYLEAFAESRRHSGRSGPYDVPGHPRDDGSRGDADDYNIPPKGQPSLWCPWTPSCGGKCLSIDDADEKIAAPDRWLLYIYEHFLKAGAAASGLPEFDGFTFDHVLGGATAIHNGDDGELKLIHGDQLGVHIEIVVPGDPDPWLAMAD